jgi:hypothetical protein
MRSQDAALWHLGPIYILLPRNETIEACKISRGHANIFCEQTRTVLLFSEIEHHNYMTESLQYD